MAKERMKARIRYHEQDSREGYAIEIRSDGEWGIDCWFPLAAREGGDGETDFIHWSILSKLAHLQAIGYDIDFQF